jgi:hypothetical protein
MVLWCPKAQAWSSQRMASRMSTLLLTSVALVISKPVMKDHLSYVTAFALFQGRSFIAGFTVYMCIDYRFMFVFVYCVTVPRKS